MGAKASADGAAVEEKAWHEPLAVVKTSNQAFPYTSNIILSVSVERSVRETTCSDSE